MTIHDLEGSAGVGGVAEVLIAGHAPHAGGEDRGSGRGARRWAPGRQAAEESTPRLLDRVQLPAGYAILLLDVLARVKRSRSTIPVDADAARWRHETGLQIHLSRDVHLLSVSGNYILLIRRIDDKWSSWKALLELVYYIIIVCNLIINEVFFEKIFEKRDLIVKRFETNFHLFLELLGYFCNEQIFITCT